MVNLPQQYLKNMEELLKEDFPNYIKSFEEKRLYGLRVNTLKISVEDFLAKNLFPTEKVKWCEEGFYYNEENRPAKHPYYHAGLYYLQEPSAMSPASVFVINEDDKVLDICAAPGGKTTHLGAKLNNTGVLVANDISAGRTKALLKNVELFGIKNAVVTSESPDKLSQKFMGYFDKILVDAPCSGEGMFRKEADVAKSWNEDMLEFCQKSQKEILEEVAKMVAPCGQILYSTCTFNPDENEKIINDFLFSHREFKLVPISEEFGFENGNPIWVKDGIEELKFTKRLFPHKIKGEGHFLALLEKEESEEVKLDFEQNTTDKRLNIYKDFEKEFLHYKAEGVLQIINNCVYMLPKNMPVLKGLRVMRSGLLLGELKKDRFEPSQALAMALKKEEAVITAHFKIDDDRVIRYLKGETVTCDNLKDGWCLVLCEGYPLGWAKSQKGRLKNKYPVGWFWN